MAGSIRFDRLLSRRVSRILFIVLMVLVLALSLIPRPETVLGSLSAYDKIGHFIAYVVLGFFAMRAVDRRGPLPFILTIAGCAVFGGVIEVVQPFVGRRMESLDFIVDLAGSMIGAALSVLLMRNSQGEEDAKHRRG